jgi:energy-coupling factor transporter transmembrane protein EcfT
MKVGIYFSITSPIQKIDIRLRMLTFLLILPAATVLASVPVLFGLMIFTLLLLQVSKINMRTFWRDAKYYVIFSFVSFFILSLIIHQGSYPIRMLGGLLLGARFATLISFGMIYALTTNPNEIPQALMKLHIPHRFGVLIMVGFRLYPLILQKMTTIYEAIKARGIDVRISFLKPVKTIKIIKLMSVPFVIATLETGARLGDTMVSRGYHPYMPITISPRLRFKQLDWACLIFILALLAFAIWL